MLRREEEYRRSAEGRDACESRSEDQLWLELSSRQAERKAQSTRRWRSCAAGESFLGRLIMFSMARKTSLSERIWYLDGRSTQGIECDVFGRMSVSLTMSYEVLVAGQR
jgi:hypothetical protein